MNRKNTIESRRTLCSTADRNTGSVEVLAPTATICAAMVGALIIGAAAVLGGSAEVHNATDAGLLNVAKQSLVSPSCPLQGETEQALFSDLLPDSGAGGRQMSLGYYNRAFARTVLYGCNAQELNTPEARAHFKEYVYPAYKALSNRLRQSMSANARGNDNNAQTIANCFTGLAGHNFLRFFSASSQSPVTCSRYSTAYVPGDGSGATNVFFKPGTLPQGVHVPTIHIGDHDYVAGYKTITFFGDTDVQGVPVNPKEQPHLIATSRFAAESRGDTVLSFMPPNAFKITAEKVVKNMHLLTDGCSVVGTMNSDHVGTLPDRGVITIANNKPGNAGKIANVNDRNVFSHWLNSPESGGGVYVTTNPLPQNNLMAVGQDAGNRLKSWVKYNTSGGDIPPGGDGIYAFIDGHWAPAGEAQLRSARNSMQEMVCTSSTMGAVGDCARMAEQIAIAYKDIERNRAISMDGNNLEAIEMQKLATLQKFIELGADQSALVGWDDCINWRIPQSLTGLRILNNGRGYNNAYTIPSGGNLQVSKAGTPFDLLHYVGECDDKTTFLPSPEGFKPYEYDQFMTEIMRRVHQVCPECSQSDVQDALKTDTLDLGQTKYLIMEKGTVRMSANPPAWYRLSTPDGKGISYSRGYYDTLGTSVDSEHDDDIEFRYFWNYSNADPTKTIDWILWTPGSGIGTDVYTGRPVPYNLGEIKFTQTAEEGGGLLCKVN